mmetsp:Transcript_34585/g.88509  ORF Transcript_34585/g.88509 Transcript_34585/m.88509 type:complete len:87 (+) Transcript_34585:525-785(+)|eukprot:jgi/Tetstr1/440152/TSEL_028509.t1
MSRLLSRRWMALLMLSALLAVCLLPSTVADCDHCDGSFNSCMPGAIRATPNTYCPMKNCYEDLARCRSRSGCSSSSAERQARNLPC